MIVNKNASLKKLNTFKVDASCDVLVESSSTNDLLEVLNNKELNNNLFILGGGSNILFTKHYQGTVINLKEESIKILDEGPDKVQVEVSAGMNWHRFVKWAVDKDFGGIENLSLIPGNVGASPIQNIGAYGVELEDVFDSCSGIMIDSLDKVNLSKSDCEFTYRSSIFKKKLKNKVIITSVRFNLTKSNHLYNIDYPDLNNLSESSLDLKKISNEVIKIRNSKLPDPKQYGNCGSFFKNPVIGYSKFQKLKEKFTEIPFFKTDSNYFKVPAAWLIDKCGFKKINDKNVGVYKNQPLVVINLGNASGNEIINFAKRIKDSVFNEFDIELEEEVIVM